MPNADLIALALVFIQSSLCTTFTAAAIQKARAAREFSAGLAAFGIPSQLRRPATNMLIACEVIAAALMLSSGRSAVAGFELCTVMLFTFSVALSRSIVSGAAVECNCFGPSGRPVSAFDVARNVGLLIVALTGWLCAAAFPSAATSPLETAISAVRTGNTTIVAVAVAAAALALVWAQLPQIAALVRVE